MPLGVTEVQITNIEKSISSIEEKLGIMQETLTKVAVQKERLDTVEKRVDGLWKKWDDDIVPVLKTCPKAQIKWLWFIVIPQGLTLIAMSIALLVNRY